MNDDNKTERHWTDDLSDFLDTLPDQMYPKTRFYGRAIIEMVRPDYFSDSGGRCEKIGEQDEQTQT